MLKENLVTKSQPIYFIVFIFLLISFAISIKKLDLVTDFDSYLYNKNVDYLLVISYILAYVIFTLLFIPKATISIAGGVVFGFTYGTLYILIGSTISAAIAFLLTRYCCYSYIEGRLTEKVKVLLDKISLQGWKVVAMVRLAPFLPFAALNYGLGLTSISFRTYILTTIIFTLPICCLYSYAGSLGVNIVKLWF